MKFEFKQNMVIGMIHCDALVGTPYYKNNDDEIIKKALEDAVTLEKAGVDAIMIENMGDTPLKETLEHEQAIFLAMISTRIRDKVKVPIGIDAAFNDYKTSLAIAKAVKADFVRIPVYVDTVLYHGGILHARSVETMNYRKKINAENVKIMADVQVKYTYMLNSEISIEDSAKMAVSSGADAVIVTGLSSGNETPIEIIERVKKVVNVPVFIGSGVDNKNIKKQFEVATGAIVGSSLKENKDISKPISYELTKELMDSLK